MDDRGRDAELIIGEGSQGTSGLAVMQKLLRALITKGVLRQIEVIAILDAAAESAEKAPDKLGGRYSKSIGATIRQMLCDVFGCTGDETKALDDIGIIYSADPRQFRTIRTAGAVRSFRCATIAVLFFERDVDGAKPAVGAIDLEADGPALEKRARIGRQIRAMHEHVARVVVAGEKAVALGVVEKLDLAGDAHGSSSDALMKTARLGARPQGGECFTRRCGLARRSRVCC